MREPWRLDEQVDDFLVRVTQWCEDVEEHVKAALGIADGSDPKCPEWVGWTLKQVDHLSRAALDMMEKRTNAVLDNAARERGRTPDGEELTVSESPGEEQAEPAPDGKKFLAMQEAMLLKVGYSERDAKLIASYIVKPWLEAMKDHRAMQRGDRHEPAGDDAGDIIEGDDNDAAPE